MACPQLCTWYNCVGRLLYVVTPNLRPELEFSYGLSATGLSAMLACPFDCDVLIAVFPSADVGRPRLLNLAREHVVVVHPELAGSELVLRAVDLGA